MKTLHARIRLFGWRWPRQALCLQVAVLTILCAVCQLAMTALHLPLPGSLVALVIVLLLLAFGVIPLSGMARGANWLLAEMLLFFIPAVMAVSEYVPLLRAQGGRIFIVILTGTVLVMTVTALLVDLVFRWEKRRAD